MRHFLIIACVIVALIQPALASESYKTATTTSPIAVPMFMDGKQVGSTTIPAGTKVTVLKEDSAAGKVLIKAGAGQAWTLISNVTISEEAVPAIVEKSPHPKSITPVASTSVESVKKRAVVLLDGYYPAHLESFVEALKAKNIDVFTASQWKTLKREVNVRVRAGSGIADETVLSGDDTQPDILLPRKATEEEIQALIGKVDVAVLANVDQIIPGNIATNLAAAYLLKSRMKVVGEADAKLAPEYIRAKSQKNSDPRNVGPRKKVCPPLSISKDRDMTGFTLSICSIAEDYKPPTLDEIKAFGKELADSLNP